MTDITALSQQIEITISALELHKQVAIERAKILPTEVKIFDDTKELCDSALRAIKHKSELPENYIANLNQHIKNIYNSLPFKEHHQVDAVVQRYPGAEVLKQQIDRASKNLEQNFIAFKFNFDVFIQLDFFENNIVLIGANGSGKTILADRLKQTFNPNNGIVISAQRVLKASKCSSITSVSETEKHFRQSMARNKTYKSLGDYNAMQNEFDIVLQNLIADNTAVGLEYAHSSKENIPQSPAPKTNLDQVIEIWNSLISHRELSFDDDHINIVPKTKEGLSYDLVQMSEGEKVMLYLIAHVLQAPKNGFIIVDEPEIYLHRSILRKLWDKLETKRADCIFVYLTHDIEFATSRDTAQKVWMKSFEPPNSWEFKSIDNSELPEELLLELLGSQKKILFCEGKEGGDERIYNILLPNFTITPVDSCKNVIDYVRAFNKIPGRLSDAFGIIDADFREQEELRLLEKYGIFSLDAAEIENLLLDETFLQSCAVRLHYNTQQVDDIKSRIFSKYEQEMEMQISHFIGSKINYIFNNSQVPRGNDIEEVTREYENFTGQIDIQKWHRDRKSLIEGIVAEKNYTKVIKNYNNKGLIAIAASVFNKGDFREFAIKHLKNNKDSQDELKRHFPALLLEIHDAED